MVMKHPSSGRCNGSARQQVTTSQAEEASLEDFQSNTAAGAAGQPDNMSSEHGGAEHCEACESFAT